ncbi:MAG: HEAT repeat domain-containing protein [Promethearchaeota archaeon]
MPSVDDLISIMESKDSTPQEKIYAITAVGKSKNIRAMDPLLSLLSDENADVKCSAIWAIGKYKNESLLPKLVPMIKDKDDSVRATAIKTLSKFSDNPELLKDILKLMTDEDPAIRLMILDAINNFDTEKIIDKVIECLENDEDTNVKIKAVEILGESIFRIQKASEALIKILEKSDNFEIQMSIIDQLSRIDPNIKEFLMHSLKGRKKLFIEDPLSDDEKGVDLVYRRNRPLVLKVKSFKEEINQLKKYIQFLNLKNQLIQ